jgi:alkyldihydroxyacetonephosphate synthase
MRYLLCRPGRHGELSAQWRTIKSTGLDAVIANGGTVTHHHAVGRGGDLQLKIAA